MRFWFLAFFMAVTWALPAQVALRGEITVAGDTIPVMQLREVRIVQRMPWRTRRMLARRNRLYRNIRIVMPYARAVAGVVRQLNAALDTIENPLQRRQYLRHMEKDLWAQYEKPLKRLTYSQGKLLIKLISRETNNSVYRLIKEYKNTGTALFWGGLARLFGMNLNYHYDPRGKDAAIEQAVQYLYPEARR